MVVQTRTTEVQMELTTQQLDRAAGVLLGQACGDALGVPYEFGRVPQGEPEMKGGGLGPYAPGEWSDDTQMAICIARVAATGADLTSAEALEAIAENFLDWYAAGATDVGIQTRGVLTATHRASGPAHVRMREAAAELHERSGRTAGNGALMRTSVVGLTDVADREATARAARAIADLTHTDPLAGDSCVIWSEAIRVAVTTGELNVLGGLDLVAANRRSQWHTWLRDAVLRAEPARHSPNGFTVTALQAALAAVSKAVHTAEGPHRFRTGLIEAVRAGNDTDTVAAIAGGLLGALHGESAIPAQWRRQVHGWPGLRSRDLVGLAHATVIGGPQEGKWPAIARMEYADQASAHRHLAVPHPHDDQVLLGTIGDLRRAPELGIDAVVSLCRLGQFDVPAAGVRPEDHVDFRLVDSEMPAANAHLDFVLEEAAAAVEAFRKEGKRVLLHCVAAQQRTPSVALRYAARLGIESDVAARAVLAALPSARAWGLLWETSHKRAAASPSSPR
jgi:ADP-ribosylglycohydrolase